MRRVGRVGPVLTAISLSVPVSVGATKTCSAVRMFVQRCRVQRAACSRGRGTYEDAVQDAPSRSEPVL